MNIINSIVDSLALFLSQIFLVIPKLIIAYVIWLVGQWLINLGLKGLDLLQVEKWKVDDSVRNIVKAIFAPTAKVILILVILDTLGIGSNVVAAFTNALTFTFAIALGLAFGRALEPEAEKVVENMKKGLQSKVEKKEK